MTPLYFLGALACVLVIFGWFEVRVLDARRRITGCEHPRHYVSQMPHQYGEALTFHCQDCGFQAPLRQLHRVPGGTYRYLYPGQNLDDAPPGG